MEEQKNGIYFREEKTKIIEIECLKVAVESILNDIFFNSKDGDLIYIKWRLKKIFSFEFDIIETTRIDEHLSFQISIIYEGERQILAYSISSSSISLNK